MSVSNYIQEKKYLIKDLDNYIYLFPFNEPILNYITDDGTLNATASNINGNGYEVYCENVSYNSNSSIDNRFSFEHTLTLTILDISTSLLNHFMVNKWMVLFKNKSGDIFVLNAEYPIDVTYQYNINDENTPNSLTITLKSLSNTPIINYNENLNYTTLREKPCGYNHSMIKRLRMLETTKGFISTSDNKIDVYMYHDTLKIIDVNPSSLSFTDSFNGDTYEQTLSFEIPLINHQFYFHYNILEYINNRYYCIIETTDGKYIVGGYKSGMFPSYTIDENNIKITLTTNTISNNTLISDYISFNEIDYNHCVGIDGECIDGLWTYKLIQRLELDGSVSNEYYALNGYENNYTDINIIGTYSRFDTTFGIKLTNPLYDCFKQCYISGLPSSLIFKNTGETQCFTIESDCDFTYSYDITVIDASFNEDTNELCVTSLKMDSSTQIKITTSDGIDRFVNVVIGTVGGEQGEQGEYDRIYRWFYNGETYCLDENQQINCESAKTTTDTITSGTCTYYKTEEYISPLCDGKYDFYGYGIGDLISCERIYRWVVSYAANDYYCDENTYTKYALEYEEYSDDNGLTWIRTDNKRVSEIILENKSEDCGYNPCGTLKIKITDTDDKSLVVASYCVYGIYPNIKHSSSNGDGTYTYVTGLGAEIACLNEHTDDTFFTNGVLNLYSVEEFPCFEPITLNRLFFECNNLVYANLSNLNTFYCTNMSRLFSLCSNLERIDLSSFNTSNVTDMSYMFNGCLKLNSMEQVNGFEKFNTSSVVNMSGMFSGNYAAPMGLTLLDLTHFDTSNVTNMNEMFYNCPNLTSLDLSSFDTSNVTNMNTMFCDCSGLTYLDLSNFDTSNVTSMHSMFQNCSSLTSLDLSNWDTSNVSYMSSMFYGCTSLTSITMNNCSCETIYAIKESMYSSNLTSSVSIITNNECYDDNTSIISFAWSGTSTNQRFRINNEEYVAKTNPYEATLSELGVSNITSAENMFSGGTKITTITSIPDTSNVTNMCQMFHWCSGLTSLDVTKTMNTSNVTNMSAMFENCRSLTSLDLSSFDTSNVTNMSGMFGNCHNLTSLYLSDFDTSNVTDMNGMFFHCYNLISLDLSLFNTSNVTDMSWMFDKCSGLTSLDLSSFDTSKVSGMYGMFRDCSGLTSLDLSNFDTSKVTDMTSLFEDCTSLTSLDLSNFNTSNVTDMSSMFSGCTKLTSLDLSNWDISYLTSSDRRYMFDDCSSLTTIKVTNCNETTISKLQEALTDAGYSSTVANGIITVNH